MSGCTRPSTVAFHEIQSMEGGARIRLSNHPEPDLVTGTEPVAARAGILLDEAPLLVAGGTLPVTLLERTDLPPGVAAEVDQDRIRLLGVPLAHGAFSASVAVQDAVGLVGAATVQIEVGPFVMEIARLADAVLGGPALTQGEETYLDANGNQNGNLDVGDMRAWRYGGPS